MKLLVILLAAWPAFAQLPYVNIPNSAGDVFRAAVNTKLSWLNSNKAGLSSCGTGQFAVQTTTGGVVCLAVDWSNLTGKPSTFTPPLPGASSLGGVKSGDCTGTDKVSGIDPATGAIKCTADQTGSSAVPVVASFSPPSTCSSSGGTGSNSCTLSSGTTLTVTHNLGTTTPWVAAYDGSGNMLGSAGASTSIVSVVANSANQVTIGFSGVTAGVLVVSTGAMGPAGANGATGPAPTVTSEPSGANCTNGGIKVVSGGSTQYVCNGVGGSGSGDVLGPATNTDGKIPQWNGANSKTLKDGLAVVTTLGNPGTDLNIPTEQAVRTALGSVGGGSGVTFVGGASTNIAAGATNYLGGINWTAGITTITSSGMFVVPITTNLSKLFIVSSSGAGTSQTITYNVVKCPGAVAGSCSVPAGTLTCTITGNSQITCNDTAHTVSVSAGDGVLLQVVSSASAIAARPTFTIQ